MKHIIKTVMWIIIVLIAGAMLFESISLVMLKRSLKTYKVYWDRQASISALDEAITYIALGDSAAQGIGATSPEKGYVGLVVQHLEQTTHRNVRIINLSVSGAKVEDVTELQIPKLQKITVDAKTILTLDIGGNDMINFDEEKFSKQVDALFSKLPPQTVVADIASFKRGRLRKLEQNVIKANEIINKSAKKYNLTKAELYAYTLEHDSLWTFSSDYFHPNNKGYRNWFEAFRRALRV